MVASRAAELAVEMVASKAGTTVDQKDIWKVAQKVDWMGILMAAGLVHSTVAQKVV